MKHWGLKVKVDKWLQTKKLYLKHILCSKNENIYYKDIPIIINNYNRLSTLKLLLNSLEERGYTNIYILDNASTYPLLLNFYLTCKYTVFKLNMNYGHLSLWRSGIYKMFIDSYYVYTDSDIMIDENCPEDFLMQFKKLLKKNRSAVKVGFSLRIDDLPDEFHKKKEVIAWESQFWKKKIDNVNYIAPIDTTFALYRPFAIGGTDTYLLNIRTGTPYLAKHLPWYINDDELSDEEKYYKEHCQTLTHWSNH